MECESYLRFLEGDTSAMQEIVEQFWDIMLLYVNSYVHSIPDAEDIAEEALIELAAEQPALEEESQVKTYLMKNCRSLAQESVKQKLQRKSDAEKELQEWENNDNVDLLMLEDRMQLDDSKRLLHRALLRLSRKHRDILYLHYFVGLSYLESATVLGCSEKHAVSAAYQARQELKKLMEKEGYFGEKL
ncbi:MAG: RNA polymerase sigma factor [Oscillospiraceae bacterium]|nr:RNA polymerase sigma factor [Oscillospiraceae bacterium]